jgi:hypothetical protein
MPYGRHNLQGLVLVRVLIWWARLLSTSIGGNLRSLFYVNSVEMAKESGS